MSLIKPPIGKNYSRIVFRESPSPKLANFQRQDSIDSTKQDINQSRTVTAFALREASHNMANFDKNSTPLSVKNGPTPFLGQNNITTSESKKGLNHTFSTLNEKQIGLLNKDLRLDTRSESTFKEINQEKNKGHYGINGITIQNLGQTLKDFRETTREYKKILKVQKIQQMEKDKLRQGIVREKEKAKVKVDRVESDMNKMKRINQVLIASNDIKERIIADLKQELIIKQREAEDYKLKFEKKKRELDWYKKSLGAFYSQLFKRKYREFKYTSLLDHKKKIEAMRNLDFNMMFDKMFPSSTGQTSQDLSMAMIQETKESIQKPNINQSAIKEQDEDQNNFQIYSIKNLDNDKERLVTDQDDIKIDDDDVISQHDILAIQNERLMKTHSMIRKDTGDTLTVNNLKHQLSDKANKFNTSINFRLSIAKMQSNNNINANENEQNIPDGNVIRQASIISIKNKNMRQHSSRSARSNKMGVSSEKGNMLLMARDQFKQYLNQKKFNTDDKLQNLMNYFNELKYSLYLLISFRDLIGYVLQLQQLKSLDEWIKSMSLNLHKYCDSSQTFIFKVKNQFKKNISDLQFESETLYQKRFVLPFNHSGLIKRAIKQQEYVQEAYIDPSTQFYSLMKEKANCQIQNATAIPIYIYDQLQKKKAYQRDRYPVYIVLLCNKKHIEQIGTLSTDEVKMANIACESLAAHVEYIRDLEGKTYAEMKLRDMINIQQVILRIEKKEDLYDYFCGVAIKELFPIFFVDFVMYIIDRKIQDGVQTNLLKRICNFDLSQREGRFKEITKYSQLSPIDIQNHLTFKIDGIVGEAIKRNQDLIIHHSELIVQNNTLIDLEMLKDYTLVTKLIKINMKKGLENNEYLNPQSYAKSQFHRRNASQSQNDILAIFQYRISEQNYKSFKEKAINKEMFENLCNYFSTKLCQFQL